MYKFIFSKYSIFLVVLSFSACSTSKDLTFVRHENIETKSFIKEFKSNKKIIETYKSKKKKRVVANKIPSVTSHISRKKTKKLKKLVKIVKKAARSIASTTYSEAFASYDAEYDKALAVFRPVINVGEEFIFSVSYFGVTAGHIRLKTMPHKEINGFDVFHLKANMRSARFYSTLYELDDSIDSFVSQDTFKPLKYSLLQRESGQNVDDLQLFDHEKLKTHVFYKRLKKGKLKVFEKTIDIPKSFQDSYSAIHFVRGLPLGVGDYYELPVVTRGKVWLLKVWIDKIEEIESMGEDVRAVKVRVETHFPGVLEKKGNIFFWFSDDEEKRLLRFDAKVKIGTISGQLIEYQRGK